jgi:hypothetical protein
MVYHPICGPGCSLTKQRSAAVHSVQYQYSWQNFTTLNPDKGWDYDGDHEAGMATSEARNTCQTENQFSSVLQGRKILVHYVM